MKIAIYSPYLDTFGGGEKYMTTIAEVLSGSNFVEVLLDQHLSSFGADNLRNQLGERFDVGLSNVRFVDAPVGPDSSALFRPFFLKKYDLIFYLTDGSIFYPTAKKNILHIQSPLPGQPAKSLWGRLKLKGWDLIIYNSKFTKDHAESNWPLVSTVIYPPVDTDKIKPTIKKKYILSVGRFFGYLKEKKHKTLIQTFKDLYIDKQLTGWSLHLAGAASQGDKTYLQELQRFAEGAPIKFYPNIQHSDLVRLYGESSVYWHATGYDEHDPVKMEHFGISTAEAMSGGCVPVVVNKGGQTEIVENSKTGLLWDSIDELKEFTILLIKDQNLMFKLSKAASIASQRFSKMRFADKINGLLRK